MHGDYTTIIQIKNNTMWIVGILFIVGLSIILASCLLEDAKENKD